MLGELWNRFHKIKPEIPELLPDGNEAGVSTPGRKKGYFTYFAGAEVIKNNAQKDWESWTMPAGEYVVCSFEAESFYLLTANALNKARDYMLGVWLPNRKLAIDPLMVELYSDISPEATAMEVWFKLKADNT